MPSEYNVILEPEDFPAKKRCRLFRFYSVKRATHNVRIVSTLVKPFLAPETSALQTRRDW